VAQWGHPAPSSRTPRQQGINLASQPAINGAVQPPGWLLSLDTFKFVWDVVFSAMCVLSTPTVHVPPGTRLFPGQ
jgi:hypothetical protein